MSCKCTTISSQAPLCKAGCIVGGYHVVYAKDSVGNCGQVGTIDLSLLPVNARNNTVCGGQVIHRLLDYDKVGFEWVSIVGSAVTFMFTNASQRNKCYKIQGVTLCPVTGNGDIFEITVCVKDLCYLVGCGAGMECDPCTGNCVAVSPDVTTS